LIQDPNILWVEKIASRYDKVVSLRYGAIKEEAILTQRRKHAGWFMARVAVEAIAGQETVKQIAVEFGYSISHRVLKSR
jgi:hypothetical protein